MHSVGLLQGVEAKKIVNIFLEHFPLVLLGEEDQDRQGFQPDYFPELLTGIFELIFSGAVNDIDEGLGVAEVGKGVSKGVGLGAKVDKGDVFFVVVDGLDVEAEGGYGLLKLLMLSKLEEDNCFSGLLQPHYQDFRSVPVPFLSLPRATAGTHLGNSTNKYMAKPDDKSSNCILMINNEVISLYAPTYSRPHRLG